MHQIRQSTKKEQDSALFLQQEKNIKTYCYAILQFPTLQAPIIQTHSNTFQLYIQKDSFKNFFNYLM